MSSDSAAAVLIVEDERIVARDLQRTLLGFGYDAFAIAASCEEALAAAAEKCPAVVLMDIRIKGPLDGIATARMLRDRFASSVVYLTSHADPDTLQRATATEPSGYLQKPVRPAELRSAIEISLHKRQAEARWRDGERWVDSALAVVSDAVIAVHPAGRILELNGVAANWLGKTIAELRGTVLEDGLRLYDPATSQSIPDPTMVAMRDGTEMIGQAYLLQGDGSERVVTYRVHPVLARSGDRVLGAILSMTESPRLAAASQSVNSDQNFRALVEAAPVGIIVHRDGKFLYVNAEFARALAYDEPTQLIGRPILNTVQPEARDGLLERIRRANAGERHVPTELPCLRRDGSVMYLEGTDFRIQFDGQPATVAVLQDITARRTVDAALQENETRYRHLFRESPVALLENDWSQVRAYLDALAASGAADVLTALRARPELALEAVSKIRFLDANDSTLGLFGATSLSELQSNVKDVFALSTYEAFFDAMNFFLKGEGGTFVVDSHTLTLRGEPREVDARLTVMPGSEQSWSRILISVIDTTSRKRAERELRASLREKDVLLREVHHRVNNNLQVISSMLNLQAMKLLDPHLRAQLVESQNRVQAIAIGHEKLYRSGDLAHIAFVDYAQTLVHELVQASAADERGVRVDLQMDDVRLGVDAAIPCGLILNELVSNALKHAFPDRRSGSIRIRLVRADRRLTLGVEDDGVGLPAGLDPEASNTLGFDLVFTFAQQLDAEVRVEQNAGTRITVSFAER